MKMEKNKDRYLYKIEEEFDYKGFKCIVLLINLPKEETQQLKLHKIKINTKWRCGYVGVDKKHILYKKHYQDLDNHNFNVNGGLTFSGFRKEILSKGYWYFGFDFNHYSNTPKNSSFRIAKQQVKRLARELLQDNLILDNLK